MLFKLRTKCGKPWTDNFRGKVENVKTFIIDKKRQMAPSNNG